MTDYIVTARSYDGTRQMYHVQGTDRNNAGMQVKVIQGVAKVTAVREATPDVMAAIS